VIGAQVVSPTILKTNQRVRISMGEASKPLRFNGAVGVGIVRTRPDRAPISRGIEFFDADADALKLVLRRRDRKVA
jgi:hypothetical protein